MSATALPNTAAPRLERPHRGRAVAGVCAGLGRHLRIDPTLVRIVFVVLSVVGGTGFVAYGAAWLLIPDEGESAPLIRRVGGRRVLTIAGVALLIAGAAATFNALIGDGAGHLVAWSVVLLGIGGWLVWGPLDRVYAPGDTAAVTSETVVVAPARRSHRATRIVGGAMLLGAGAVTLIAASGVDLSGQEVAGVAVVAAGVALAIGAFFGASPWLAIPPLVVAASVAALAAAGVALHGPVGERTFSPVAASQLSGTYRVAIGQGNLDLRHTALPIGTTHVK